MRISPISVDKLKYYDWFYSEDHNLWYYFRKRKNDSLNSSELDDTLDPKIKGIVKFLNDSGYDTLPSCEGHNRTKNFIDKAWKNLLNDRKKICTVGLWLCNCENDNRYFLMDPNWKIPFSYSEFSDICSGKKEVVGYIGFYCKDKLIFNLLEGLFSNDSYVSVKFHDNIIEIFNNSKDDNVRGEKWSLVEKVLRDVIKERGE
jgi:hypothetical protein